MGKPGSGYLCNETTYRLSSGDDTFSSYLSSECAFPSLFVFTGMILSCAGGPWMSRKMSMSGGGFNASLSAILYDGWQVRS